MAVCVGTLACSDPWPAPGPGTFTGIYISAFEASSFRRCGTREAWWLTDASQTLHAQLPPAVPPDFVRSGYIVVDGGLSARGQYGHLGSYPRELTVTEVLSVSADTANKCP